MCGDYVCSSVYDTFLVPEQTFLKSDMGDTNSDLLDNSNFQPYWPIMKPSLHKAINRLPICLINHFADIKIWHGQLAPKLVRRFQFSAIFFCVQEYITLTHEGTFPCVINHFTEFNGIQYERLLQKFVRKFWLSASIIKPSHSARSCSYTNWSILTPNCGSGSENLCDSVFGLIRFLALCTNN